MTSGVSVGAKLCRKSGQACLEGSFNGRTHCDGKNGCHPVQVVRVASHLQYLRYDGLSCPLNTEYLRQPLQVHSRSLTDAVNVVPKPRHTEVAELLIEERHTELVCQERDVLDNRLSNAPLLVLSKFDDGR